jgi:heavy metal sensor kinase
VKIHTLRFKLIWLNGIAIALLMICVGLISHQIFFHKTNKSFNETLLNDAQLFAANIRPGQNSFEWPVENLDPKQNVIMLGLQYHFVVTDPGGKILHQDLYNPFMQRLIRGGGLADVVRNHSGFSDVSGTTGEPYRFVSIEIPEGMNSMPAIIHVGRSIKDLKWIMGEDIILYLYSIPFILMISAAIGWFLSNRALHPFEELSKAAEQISSENLNTKIVSKYKEEEIQTLVHSFNSMVERLNHSFQQMRRFNADAAHELRTPLCILRGETELLLNSPDSDKEEIKSYLESSLEELDQLTQIVNDMLILAEAGDNEQIIAREPINIKATIKDIVERMRPLAAAREIRIKVLNLPDMRIEGDRLLVHRAIFNIMDNAIKYSMDRGIVEVDSTIEKKMIRLKIRDYGVGIPADDLPNVFDRRFRADHAGTRIGDGSGLGLSIVKWIIEAHKGMIQVTSNVDQGTQFEVILPIHPSRASAI